MGEVLIYLPPRVRLLLYLPPSQMQGRCADGNEEQEDKGACGKGSKKTCALETLFCFRTACSPPFREKRAFKPKVKKFIFSNSSRGQNRANARPGYNGIIKLFEKTEPASSHLLSQIPMDCDDALSMCHHKMQTENEARLNRR
jgi:hypothetical protein